MIVGFLVAPLVGWGVLTLLLLLFFPDARLFRSPYITLFFYAPFLLPLVYAATWALGIPAYVLWQRFRSGRPAWFAWIGGAMGALIVAITMLSRWRSDPPADAMGALARWTLAGALAGTATGAAFTRFLPGPAVAPEPESGRTSVIIGFLASPLAGAIVFWLVSLLFGTEARGLWLVFGPAFFVLPAAVGVWSVGIPAYLLFRRWDHLHRSWFISLLSTLGLLVGAVLAIIEGEDGGVKYLVGCIVAGTAAGIVLAVFLPASTPATGDPDARAITGFCIAPVAGIGTAWLLLAFFRRLADPPAALFFVSPAMLVVPILAGSWIVGIPAYLLWHRRDRFHAAWFVPLFAGAAIVILALATKFSWFADGAGPVLLFAGLTGAATGATFAAIISAR